ncbi:MAG TPA: hypothetical protein VMR23_14670 [Candidatus Limnocylindria bacterium]|nr:hypothetical protein [Candidatus Limnocylindria bacterium]
MVHLLPGDEPLRHVALEWSTLPLSWRDELEYHARILPQLTRRVQEYMERPGPALVLA